MNYDICIIGGAGHVGLPLALVFAASGLRVVIEDLNQSALAQIHRGEMPFTEEGGEAALKAALATGRLSATNSMDVITDSRIVVVTIGTPVDEFLNPDHRGIRQWANGVISYLRDDQTLILRSTLYPGTTKWLHDFFRSRNKSVGIAYCPERIVQGNALEELSKLPQIVSGTTPAAVDDASRLFQTIAPSIVKMEPNEAEFAKLFANVFRYVQFAVANQFYMIADSAGVDYYKILEGLKKDYPRLAGLPGAGFAAGPCLFKDTMQLAAFAQNHFALGHAAMLVNEGLVLYLVQQIRTEYPSLSEMRVGLLGMAFKAESDDIRSSLSYKLKKLLDLYAKEVLVADPHVVVDPAIIPAEEVIEKSDLLILCVPHSAYRGIDLRGKKVMDVWNFFGRTQKNPAV